MSSTLKGMRLSGKKCLRYRFHKKLTLARSHLPSPTVVNLQQAFKSHEDWVPVMPPSDGFTDISVDRHEYQVSFLFLETQICVVLWCSTQFSATQAIQ